ncbi:MAG: hypothetical protein ACI9CA_000500 [Natronomonas sp.]|jgi:hypothetical protein
MPPGTLHNIAVNRTHPPTRLSTRPDDRPSTPAGLVGYLAVLAVGLGLMTAPVVVGAGLAAAGLAAVVALARPVAQSRSSDSTAGVGVDPDCRPAD